MKFKLPPHSILLILCLNAFSQKALKFDFGPKPTADDFQKLGFTKVTPQSLYSDAIGYGFEDTTGLKTEVRGGYNDFITSEKPFFFSVKLPEGNYKITLKVGDTEGVSSTTIRVENRRMMVENRVLNKGMETVSFSVHVRDSFIAGSEKKVRLKPRERPYFHWDNKLTFEINGKSPKIDQLTIESTPSVKTVFLAGNSTVVDQAEEPYAAWGQMIPAFFNDQIAVANYAESGESASSFISERRLEKILSLMKKGDYLFIEFGHNDQKQKGEGIGAFTSFKRDLKFLINETRKKGGIPVLVAAMNRRSFDSLGKITNTLGDYPEAARQTSKEENTPLIDLHAMSKTLYEAWGDPLSKKAFVIYPANTFPNQPKALDDNTHFNPFGAYQIACCVAKGIRSEIPELAAFFRKNLPDFDPSVPDKPKAFEWFLSPKLSVVKPDGN